MKVKIISAKSVAILERMINKFLSEGKIIVQIIVRNIDMTKADKEYLCSIWYSTPEECVTEFLK